MQSIFDIPDLVDESLLDVFIIQKISEVDDVLDYFVSCFNREKNYNSNHSLRYFLNYILIDIDGNAVTTIVNSINQQHLEFIENFYKYLYATDNQLIIDTFKKAYIDLPYGNERFSKLEILFKSKYIRENVFHEFYNTGQLNERNGFFALLCGNWDLDINQIKPIFDLFIEDNESCYKLIKLFHNNLKQNIAYTHTHHKSISTTKCASLKYNGFILKSLLYINSKIVSEPDIKNLSELYLKDYNFLDDDCLANQLIVTTILAMKIAYVPLARIYITYKSRMEFPFFVSEDIKLQYDRIKQIYLNKEYLDEIIDFLDKKIICKNISISDDFSQTFNDLLLNIILDHDYKLSENFINYLLDTIGGNLKVNKHQRFSAFITIITIIEKLIKVDNLNDVTESNLSFMLYNSLQPIYNDTNKLLNSIIKFLVDVDHFEWTQFEYAHVFFRQSNSLVYSYCDKIDKSKINLKNTELLFHKTSSKLCSLITELTDICQKISDKYDLKSKSMIKRIHDEYTSHINEYIKSLIDGIRVLQKLISSEIITIKSLSTEIVLPLGALTIAILNYLSDGKNIIYTIFRLNMETLELMQELFKLINMSCENQNFIEKVMDNIDIIKEMVTRVKLDQELKDNLVNYLGNLDIVKNDEENLPEEFFDPLLATEIKNPVMIPKIDTIFDKSSIMSHLYREQTHPYTRESLTIEDFEEYNKKDEVREKIRDFVQRLVAFKNNNKKSS